MAQFNVSEPGAQGVQLVGLKIATSGDQFPNPIRAHLKYNRWYQANTFDITIALYGDTAHDYAWWGSMDRVDQFPIEIYFGVGDPASGQSGIYYEEMMVGQIDKFTLDLSKGTVHATGRDLTSLLIDTYTMNAFPNRSVADIINALCSRVGITADTANVPDVKASEYYVDQPYVLAGGMFNKKTSYWDMICFLAQRANCVPYMDNTGTLHIYSRNQDQGSYDVTFVPNADNSGPVVKLNPSNTEKLTLTRDLNLARNTSVEVRSYNSRGEETFAGIDSQSKLRGGNKSRSIRHITSGLRSQDEANQLANTIYDQTILHEKKVHWTEPGNLTVTTLQRVNLIGGNSNWHDTPFYFESIERIMDWRQGFTMKCAGTGADPALASVLVF